MLSNHQQWPIEIKDLYKTLIETRNFEITMFWQRSNYFLGLNTGIAFGFFNLKEPKYAFILAIIGLIASILWLEVCLGSKFWQSRWEQRLQDFEREYLVGIDFFSATAERAKNDVSRSFDFNRQGGIKRRVYRKLVVFKPSVSLSMILLSMVFILGWLTFMVTFFQLRRNPFT